MKKLLCAALAAVMLFSMIPVFSFSASAEDNFCVALPEDPADTEKYAAEALSGYIGQMTGKDCPVVPYGEADGRFCFFVGDTPAADKDLLTDKPDGCYIIEPAEGGCAIYGAGNRGTIYGVFGYLEDYCGYRCYTAEGGMTTAGTQPGIPEERKEYSPAFEYTDTDWHSPRDPLYSVANGLNGRPYRDIPAEMGGTVAYISGFCHTLATQFCAPDTYFEEHPEYFALHNGIRDRGQLCLTNEDVFNVVLDEVFALLREKHDPSQALQIISLTQNDNRQFCECSACKALDDENGSHAGSLLTFINRVAKEVAAAGYDNVAIDTFAYQYTRACPTAVVPEPNVIVRLCTIECCFVHALDDENCGQNAELMKDLADWGKICDRMYVWDYTTNYAYTAGIFPDFGVLQRNMRIFRDNSVRGVYEEGAYYVDSINTEFGELRAYLISRLLRDPDCDFDAEMRGFCRAFYGEGGENIADFLNEICKYAARTDSEIYSTMKEAFPLTDDEVKTLDAFWEKAKTAAADDETATANILRSEISWRFVKSSLGKGEFSSFTGRMDENKKLYADIAASGATVFSEGGGDRSLTVSPFYYLMGADMWRDGDGLGRIFTLAALVFTVLACAAAAVILVIALKNKNFVYLVLIPVAAAIIYVMLWNRRAYLAWRDIDQYAISSALLLILIALVYFLAAGRFRKKKVVATLVAALSFAVLYEAPLLIINVLMYDGKANNLAFSVAMLTVSAGMFAVLVSGAKKFPKNTAKK